MGKSMFWHPGLKLVSQMAARWRKPCQGQTTKNIQKHMGKLAFWSLGLKLASKMIARSPQVGPKMPQHGPKMPTRSPKMAPRQPQEPKMNPRCPKIAPSRPQQGSREHRKWYSRLGAAHVLLNWLASVLSLSFHSYPVLSKPKLASRWP